MKLLKCPSKALIPLYALFLPLSVSAAAPQWESWVSTQVQHHPEMAAARSLLAATRSTADAQEQALYNPEFASELERVDGVKNYRIGLDQTVDWWDKQDARIEQSHFIRQAAELNYQNLVMERVATVMTALVEWESAQKVAEMARKQKSQLDTLLSLVEKRRAAGDMGSIDAELTFLSLSQRLSAVAEAEAGLKKAESTVMELLPEWSPAQGSIPAAFWSDYHIQEGEAWIESHPAVAAAKAEWKTLEQQAEITHRDAKADPTFGIKAGRDDNVNAVGLSFSIPLNVRNTYSAETSAARQEALEAEALFHAQYRRQKFSQQSAVAAWQEFEKQHQNWRELMFDRIESSAALLERQWESGDLSTTDYLMALDHRAEGLMAGVSLHEQALSAQIDARLQSGQIIVDSAVDHN